VLPVEGDFTNCDQLADKGRSFLRTETDPSGVEHQVCEVEQQPIPDRAGGVAPTAPGWFYDDFTAPVDERCGDANTANGIQGQRISFTAGAEPKTGVTVRLECLQPVSSTEPGVIGLGTPCAEDASICATSSTPNLFCNSVSNTCTQACSSDADCAGAGLGGFVCGDSLAQQKCGEPEAAPGDCFCVNPTCGGV